MKHKNRVTEVKYKRYKNKLTGILRKAEKDYYNNLLQNHKIDLKLTWATLNGLIKMSLGNVYPDQFQRNGKILTNKLDIANGFNEFFVNVGPSVANKIKSPSNKFHIFYYMKSRNDKSMFINDVTQNELCKVVNNFLSKACNNLFCINDLFCIT